MECAIDGDTAFENIYEMAELLLKSRRARELEHPLNRFLRVLDLQSKGRAWIVGKKYYDDANDATMSMLDQNQQYTCGYWKNASNLDEAQFAKMELIAQKLKLQPGMTVLDIGCGYGTLAYHLAKNYGGTVVGCTISKEHVKFAENLYQGLPCDFRLCDYRDILEEFDRIVSVGMFEHVGPKYYKTFFKVCHGCLKEDGILLLHTIGNSHKNGIICDMFSQKYIFPNGQIPYYLEVCSAIEGSWIIEDWHNFGYGYYKTLTVWEENFKRAWPTLQEKYDEKFHRMWIIYLQTAQSFFSTRAYQLWQIVLSKDGLPGGYQAAR